MFCCRVIFIRKFAHNTHEKSRESGGQSSANLYTREWMGGVWAPCTRRHYKTRVLFTIARWDDPSVFIGCPPPQHYPGHTHVRETAGQLRDFDWLPLHSCTPLPERTCCTIKRRHFPGTVLCATVSVPGRRHFIFWIEYTL